MACAMFLAVRAMFQMAIDGAKQFPIASEITQSSSYADDKASGADSVEELKEIYCQMNALHRQGGLELAKRNSNSTEFMPEIHAEPTTTAIALGGTGILGMMAAGRRSNRIEDQPRRN